MVTLPAKPVLEKQIQQKQNKDEEQEDFKTNRTHKNNKESENFQIYETPYQNLIDKNTHSKLK